MTFSWVPARGLARVQSSEVHGEYKGAAFFCKALKKKEGRPIFNRRQRHSTITSSSKACSDACSRRRPLQSALRTANRGRSAHACRSFTRAAQRQRGEEEKKRGSRGRRGIGRRGGGGKREEREGKEVRKKKRSEGWRVRHCSTCTRWL